MPGLTCRTGSPLQVIQTEGNGLSSDVRKVLLDTATGVQYLFVHSG